MAGWFLQNLHFFVAAIATAVGLALYYRWRAAALRRAVLSGAPVSFHAWLRGPAAPYPRRWREGRVRLGLGPPVWKPRFAVIRRPIELPMSAAIKELRRVSGLREILSLSADCVVLLVQGDETTIELAVMSAELPPVLQALESQSGGGWRVPPSLAVDVARARSIPR